jgi:hypothetical protein
MSLECSLGSKKRGRTYRAPTALYRMESPSITSLVGPTLGVATLPTMLWRLLSAMIPSRVSQIFSCRRVLRSVAVNHESSRRSPKTPEANAGVMQAWKNAKGATRRRAKRGARDLAGGERRSAVADSDGAGRMQVGEFGTCARFVPGNFPRRLLSSRSRSTTPKCNPA